MVRIYWLDSDQLFDPSGSAHPVLEASYWVDVEKTKVHVRQVAEEVWKECLRARWTRHDRVEEEILLRTEQLSSLCGPFVLRRIAFSL